ncbi:uncharacterized protein LOC105735872 isoform X4 [Apis florea]|uniref:uncharacterized protein LOC105735872 isoform X4 n=1 Tax=Apis florea TaxID=7463 RepID=UPI0012FEF98F|nr:uncharacterized protein LOC105735872 isoform X4 [Apis florea]XP_031773557.1 uncharacterized protein LOC105735872 isoform X4 [Apis florea]
MSIAAAENAGPSPRELQDPLWVKMSAITGSISKKRKKSDAKPQSQIFGTLGNRKARIVMPCNRGKYLLRILTYCPTIKLVLFYLRYNSI